MSLYSPTLSAQAIDGRVEAAIAGLRAALDARPSRRVLLLCDATLADPMAGDIARAGLARRMLDLQSQGATPPPLYLAEVPDEMRFERLINASLRAAIEEATRPAPSARRPRSMSAWLATDLPLAEVAARLERRAQLRDTQGRLRVLRFWDPRSTQHLAELYPGVPASSWIAGAAWMFVDAYADWHYLPDAGGHSSLPAWDKLEALSRANAVVQRLNADGLCCGRGVLEPVRNALNAARSVGLVREDDQILFAAWRVRLAAPIEQAPGFAALLREIEEEGGSLRGAAQDLDDEDWTAFALQAQERLQA